MSTDLESRKMTIEEFLALPDDGVDRELIRGELRVRGLSKVTRRNRHHARSEAKITKALECWLEEHTRLGEVVSGEAGFILKPDSGASIDVAYVSPEIAARQPNAPFFQGPPVLAVEILSPSDKQEDIDEKIALYLESGVKVVWVVNPSFKTVTVYRPDAAPTFFHENQTIDAEPHLRGFGPR
jgi:Uma2 family endonuclease